ncbi:hypothetical protein GOBAR_AA05639 [Gossypium barbadense]|uniref:Uncharacterized protein n=1 Tax=Gossypium barbadense TaxID=3634 RepID=A0A2P5YH58_GOSBA|nr:hypothetical protein GOBAR_AA05639 [Gossypium barbadense]
MVREVGLAMRCGCADKSAGRFTQPRDAPVYFEGEPVFFEFCKLGHARLLSHAHVSWVCVEHGNVIWLCLALFASPMPVCYGSTLVYCCTWLNGTSVSHARVKETESSLVPGTLVVTYEVHPRPCRTAVGMYCIPCFGEIMYPVFTRPYPTTVFPSVLGARP